MPGFGPSAILTLIIAAGSPAQEQALREAARLDAEGKCEQAEPIYRRALAQGAPSAALLNNAGNHYLLCGQPDRARQCFLALLKMNPAHQNANLQMARLSVERKQAEFALRYLSKVKEDGPAVALVRAEALHWTGKNTEAEAVLTSIQRDSKGDPRILFSLGLTAARMGRFALAESAFGEVATQVPADVSVLINLGRAAFHAGHSSRAVFVLAQARKLEPANPEVLLLLARAAEDAGFHGDAVAAYGEYLGIKPGDDHARRDRARLLALNQASRTEGLKELEWFVRKRPADPGGHFALAQVIWDTQPDAALAQLSETIKLDAGFAPAYFGRAWLLQRLGRVEESLPDLEAAARLAPKNSRALDQLGVTYLALDKPAEAEKTLRAALAASPHDRAVLMHLGRALMALNRATEAQQYLTKFRDAPEEHTRDPRKEPGMIALATMPAAEQARIQIERLRKEAADYPDQPELQLRLAQLLLSEGRREEASAAFRELESRNADASIWWEAGSSLLSSGEYAQACEFLRRAASVKPEARNSLAVALMLSKGPEEGLNALDQAPESGRTGDWHIIRARLLEALGRRAEAEQALQTGLPLLSADSVAVQQAVLLLVSLNRPAEALAPLDRASRAHPASADLALMRAIILGLLRREDADRSFRQIQSRWPEWGAGYVAHGLLLLATGSKNDAKSKFEAALALDPKDPFALCGAAMHASQPPQGLNCECRTGLRQLLLPSCVRP